MRMKVKHYLRVYLHAVDDNTTEKCKTRPHSLMVEIDWFIV